jgi:predicted PurR-regulated permease PerM
MTASEKDRGAYELSRIVLATAVIIGMGALAILFYELIDVLFMLFVGILIAAALQPWHAKLCSWGVPKAVAVLMIYVAILIGLASIALLIGPALVDQIGSFATDFPKNYSVLRASLAASEVAPLRLVGQRLPPFERLTSAVTTASPGLYQGVIGVTMSAAEVIMCTVAVFAIAFYWTMEVGRFERLIMSLVPVEQRLRTLNIWHEIESKLGGFVRGQGMAMLAVGVASGAGYALIGLPNPLTLGVLAGLLEAVPLLGPVLAAVPAVIVALPLGFHAVLLVVGLAAILQLTENYVLIPRIMGEAVGVSALVNILAVIAFGELYGLPGVFLAIPITATVQVVLGSLLIDGSPVDSSQGPIEDAWSNLRKRLEFVRQRVRDRLRSRESRMGIDPQQADHVVDAVEHRIELAATRVEESISEAQRASGGMPAEARARVVERLTAAIANIEQIVDLMHPIVEGVKRDADWNGSDTLARTTGEIGKAVERVEALVATTVPTPKEPREG